MCPIKKIILKFMTLNIGKMFKKQFCCIIIDVIAAEGSLLFLTLCYSAFEFPANSFCCRRQPPILDGCVIAHLNFPPTVL
jgi:hypothetical protein